MAKRTVKTVLCLLGLTLLAVGLIALFLFWNFSAYSFHYRTTKLVLLVLVAYSIAVSTVLFQTISNNRLLTPSIMGFDQLYLLIQTALLYALGKAEIPGFSIEAQFVFEAAILTVFATVLFRLLFSGSVRGLHLTLLIGVVSGSFFFSLRMLLQLRLDPDAAIRLTDLMFASFNEYHTSLLTISVIIVVMSSIVGWRLRHMFDVLTLGRDPAISLGVDFKRTTNIVLILVSILVSVSTALVGPVTFFGLLVASLAYQLAPVGRHAVILPVAALIAIIFLVGGQFVLEQLFNMGSRLTFIIEFIGGLIFLTLVVRGKLR